MNVFIENEAGSNKKNLFDEKTLEYKKTVVVSRPYPYPYGFILNTTAGDGDNLDCFVLTDRPIKSGVIVDVEPIGMFEMIDNGEEDHKILAHFLDEGVTIDEEVRARLREFIHHVFDHLPEKKVQMGDFFDGEAAMKLLKKSQ